MAILPSGIDVCIHIVDSQLSCDIAEGARAEQEDKTKQSKQKPQESLSWFSLITRLCI